MTLKVPGLGPIVVIRSRDGKEINAFVNICRHRGAMLLPEVRQAQNIVYSVPCAAIIVLATAFYCYSGPW
jgi:hypothetical protein